MLTQNNDYKLLSFFKDPSTSAPTTMNPTTVTTTTVSTVSTEGIYSKYSLIENTLRAETNSTWLGKLCAKIYAFAGPWLPAKKTLKVYAQEKDSTVCKDGVCNFDYKG